jgi:REP element-mobilizing transposase RayT
MSHAYARNYIHLVFGTKERRNWIRNSASMHRELTTIAAQFNTALIAIGGTNNHVHLLFHLSPRIPLATLVRNLKTISSKHENDSGHLFAWQEGYGAFSVSPSRLDATREYIEQQEEHHKRRDFAEEFRMLIEKSGISYSDRVFG